LKSISNKINEKSNMYFGWYVLIGIGLVQIANTAAGSLNFSMFVVPMSSDLKISRTIFSGAISIGSVLAALSSMPFGYFFDLKKTRQVLILSVVTLGICTYAMSYVSEWILLYVLIAILRMIFTTPMMVGGSIITAKWFIAQRGKANGLLYAMHSVGMFAFPLLSGIFIVNYGWRSAWEFNGLLVILIALIPCILLVYEEPSVFGININNEEKTENIPINFSVSEAVKTKALWILAIGTGVLYFFHSGINTHHAAFLLDRNISIGFSALAISINAFSTGLGSYIWGLICDRINIKFAFSAVFVCSMIALLVLIYTYDLYFAILSSMFFGFAMGGMLTVPSVAYANFYGTDSLGKIRGITNPITTIGAATGVMVSGIIFDINSSYTLAFWIYFLMSIFMVFFSLLLNNPGNKK
tara:strand:+ start:1733 stop:2968 length:1236 start_codon:yes stop_codon:yes gene_type:complete